MSQTQPKIIAHRGFSGKYPENTLLSIQKALALGVDRIEIDIHQTKDGIPILMHDVTIDRTTTGTGKVKDFTYSKISTFNIKGFDNEIIPTLDTILATINGKASLMIELKKGNNDYPNIEQNTINLIKKYNAYDWCYIISFHDEILEKVHELDEKVKLSKTFYNKLFINFKKYEYCHEFNLYYKLATKKLIKRIHKHKKKLNVWTVNKPKKMNKMIRLCVDGIITNFPDYLIKILSSKAE